MTRDKDKPIGSNGGGNPAGTLIVATVRTPLLRYLPMTQLLLAEAAASKKAASTVEVWSVEPGNDIDYCVSQWKGADLVLLWEPLSQKSAPHVLTYFDVARAVRNECRARVAFGGFWPTAFGRHYPEFDVFDLLFDGYSITRAAEFLAGKGQPDERWVNIRGPVDFAGYRLRPDRLKRPERFLINSPRGRTLTGYRSSFLCRNNCTFCFTNHARQYGAGYEERSLEQVKADMAALDAIFHFDCISFKDSYFYADLDRSRAIIKCLHAMEKGVSGNVDITIRQFSPHILSELKLLAGGRRFFFGLESFDPDRRKEVGKPYSQAELHNAIKTAEKMDVELRCNLILTLPVQSENSLRESIRQIVTYMRKYPNLYINANVYKPEPGTALQRKHFPDILDRLPDVKELQKLWSNRVGDLQGILYGDKFRFIDLQKCIFAIKLLNTTKYVIQNTTLPFKLLPSIFRRWLERQLTEPYFRDQRLSDWVLDEKHYRQIARIIGYQLITGPRLINYLRWRIRSITNALHRSADGRDRNNAHPAADLESHSKSPGR